MNCLNCSNVDMCSTLSEVQEILEPEMNPSSFLGMNESLHQLLADNCLRYTEDFSGDLRDLDMEEELE